MLVSVETCDCSKSHIRGTVLGCVMHAFECMCVRAGMHVCVLPPVDETTLHHLLCIWWSKHAGVLTHVPAAAAGTPRSTACSALNDPQQHWQGF